MVYQGTSNSYKINKLQEMTSYDFRIFASNAAGSGPYSEVYTFTTLKAPPPVLKGKLYCNLLPVHAGIGLLSSLPVLSFKVKHRFHYL